MNGVLSASVAGSAPVLAATWSSLQLSSLDSSLTPWSGYVDDLRLSARAVYGNLLATRGGAHLGAGDDPAEQLRHAIGYSVCVLPRCTRVVGPLSPRRGPSSARRAHRSTPSDPVVHGREPAQLSGAVDYRNVGVPALLDQLAHAHAHAEHEHDLGRGKQHGRDRMNWSFGTNFNGVTSSTNSVPLNTWTHRVRLQRQPVHASRPGALRPPPPSRISGRSASTRSCSAPTPTATYFDGLMDDLRISNIARYNAAFSPPTERIRARRQHHPPEQLQWRRRVHRHRADRGCL